MKPSYPTFKKIALVAAATLLYSCDRAVEEKATITIQLPGNMPQQSGKMLQSNYVNNLISQNLSAMSTSVDWNPIQVTSKGDLDCLFVIAGGPGMDANVCSKDTKFLYAGEAQHFFSEMAGPVALGSQITMNVLAGKDRVFKLFGMKTTTKDACVLFTDKEKFLANKPNLSKPYLIGESVAQDIYLSKPNEVEIKTRSTFDQTDYVDYCTVESLLPPNSGTDSENGKIEFKIENGAFGEKFHDSQCVPIYASVYDKDGKPKFSDINDEFELQFGITSKLTLTLFPNQWECNKNILTNTTDKFSTYESFDQIKWIKPNMSVSATYNYELLGGSVSNTISVNSGTETIDYVLPSQIGGISYRETANTGALSILALFPEKIKNGVCTPIRLSRDYFDFSAATSGTDRFSSVDRFDIEILDLGSGRTVNLFSDFDCETALSGSTVKSLYVPPSNGAITLYAYTSGFSDNETIEFKISSYSSTALTDLGIFKAKTDGSTDNNFSRLAIQGPGMREKPGTNSFWDPIGKCIGPFRIYAANQNGSYVNLTSNYAFQIGALAVQAGYKYKDATTIKFFAGKTDGEQDFGADNPCVTGREILSTESLSIGGTTRSISSVVEFYIRLQDYNFNSIYSPYKDIYLTSISKSLSLPSEELRLNLINSVETTRIDDDATPNNTGSGGGGGGSEGSAGKISSGK